MSIIQTKPGNKDSQGFQLSMDVFYLYVAGYINAIPTLRAFIDDLYETNKIAFYNKAKESPYYNATFMTDRPLNREVSMRRAFGVLMYAEQDEQLQDTICKAIIKHNKAWGIFAKSYTVEQFADFMRTNSRDSAFTDKTFDELNAPLYLVAYIIYCKHGLAKKERASVKRVHDFVAADVAKRESYAQNHFIDSIDRYPVEKVCEETKQIKDFKTAARTNRSMCSLIFAVDALQNRISPQSTTSQKMVKILSKCTDEERNSVILTTGLVSKLFSLYGCSVSLAAEDIHFTEEELERIYRITAINSDAQDSNNAKEIRLSDYSQALWFAMLIKALHQDRAFYFKNNSETQFYALRSLENTVQQLNDALTDQRNATMAAVSMAAAHKDQINLLNAELAKENKDAAKPLMAEIALLRSQIAELQSSLDAEAEKAKELYRLREFVFDMQQGSDIPAEEIYLDKLINGKRIYIFGGHINWRNKVKQKYPKLEILDGHNTSFDVQKLLGADMVLMNTSNMSHDLYYKIIEVLRKNNIPFNYLGKYHNTELLEKEIADALL